jgi:hypothetical protein
LGIWQLRNKFIKVSGSALVLAASQLLTGQAMSQSSCNVLKVAEIYVSEHFPNAVSAEMKPVISEQDRSWIVEYRLPVHMLGGGPVITIDKNTCKVIDAYRTQ